MQLEAAGTRLGITSTLHAPPRIHAPPRPAIAARAALRVAVADTTGGAYTGGGLRVTPLSLRADGTTGDALADDALRTASIVDGFLRTTFGRNGVDGRGGVVELVVHAPDRRNAYWDKDSNRIELGDGDGSEWGAFGRSVSVVAHELYHGVIDAEVKLDYEKPEQAALHESLADVFAAGVAGTWRIGADVFTPGIEGDEIRNLAKPAVGHLDQAKRAGGVAHTLSGVASLAAVRAADAIGPKDMQRVWYRALTDHLPDAAGFTQAATATMEAAADLFGAGSSQQAAVRQAWESVGVLQRP